MEGLTDMTNENVEESLPASENPSEPVAALVAESDPEPAPLKAEPVSTPTLEPAREPVAEEPVEDFEAMLRAFEKSHSHQPSSGQKQLQGTVVSLSADQVFLDIGYKTEGVLPRSAFDNNAESVKPGDSFPVSVTGRNEEGYY